MLNAGTQRVGFSVGRAAIASVVLLVGAMVGGCTGSVSDRDIENVTVAEVRALTKSPKPDACHLIDPRSPSEFAAGHIPGAENVQLQSVAETRHSIDPRLREYKLLVVYGNDPGSGLAKAMTKRLIVAGARDVKMFAGGLSEWQLAGYPVEKGTPDRKPSP